MIQIKTILTTAGLLFSMTSFAYVPPMDYSLGNLVKKRSSLKTIRIRTRIKGEGAQFKETLWYDAASKRIRAKVFDEADQLLFAYEKKNTGSLNATFLTLENQSSSFFGALKANGFPVGEAAATSEKPLGRVKNLLGWIYSGKRQELWVQKDEFTVLKWVSEEGGSKVEVTFEDTRLSRDLPYPRMITLSQDGTERLTGEAIEVSINPDLADLKTQTFSARPETDSAVLKSWLKWIR